MLLRIIAGFAAAALASASPSLNGDATRGAALFTIEELHHLP